MLSFQDYVAKQKKQFQPQRYQEDIHYRAVLFHQFGESYRWYCKSQQCASEYDQLAYDVACYERRIQMYRSA